MSLACFFVALSAQGAEPSASKPPNNPIEFCAALSPDEESAPTYSDARGQGRFTLRRADLSLTWKISFKHLSGNAVAANVHGPQRPGAEAGVLFALTPSMPQSPVTGQLVLNDGQVKYLLSGRMYVNITTAKHPAGELRGQVERIRPGAACPGMEGSSL